MTLGPSDARPDGAPVPSQEHDPSIVPGLADPVPAPRVQPLDMSKDPDRFDPHASISVVGPLDPRRDPVRADAGRGQSLTDLVGKKGAYEEERDNYTWALGLLGVLAFLALVAFLFGEVLSA